MTTNPDRVTGWWIFAGIMLSIAGVLNSVYGIAAIAAMLSIPAYPFWSLAIFALAIIVVYQLAKPYDGTA